MKKPAFIVVFIFISAIGLISSSVIDNGNPGVHKSMGGPPYNTNAPGEKTCSGMEGTNSCHSGGIPDNSGPASVAIVSSGGTMYVPGQTYTITPTITHQSRMRFGFQLVVLRVSNNANAGNITITDTTNTQSQIPGYGNCQTCEYAMHKKPGTYFSTTTGQWSFTWQAPSTNVGNIRMYACFNAANNNDVNDSGDETFFTTLTLTPSMTGIREPEISSCVTIFPNPANGFFDLDINLEEPGNVSADLLSTNGRLIQHCFEKNSPVEKIKERIFFKSPVPEGIYFLKIYSAGKTMVKKIIISME